MLRRDSENSPGMSADRRAHQSGQAMAELGIVIVMLVFIMMGILEFGRMLMLLNMVTSATHDGARFAATAQRAAGGCNFASVANIKSVVTTQLQNVGLTSGVNVNVSRGAAGGFNTVSVATQVPISFMFAPPFLAGPAMNVNRQVTFRDEICP